MNKHPKVLVLSSFSQSTANGITVANLFKDWPVERIAVAEFSEGISEIYAPGIESYYTLGSGDSRFVWPFSLLRKLPPSAHHDLSKAPEAKPPSKPRAGRLAKWKSKLAGAQVNFLHRSGIAMVSRRYWISPEFDAWVREFSPDIIYAVTSDVAKLDYLLHLKEHFKTKIALHIFDDYVNSKHEATWFPGYWKRRLDTSFRRTLEAVDLPLAIGDKMAEEYTKKYGKKFYGFHNPIDPSIWLAGQSQMDDGESEQSSVIANSEKLMAEDKNSPSAIRHSPSRNANERSSFAFLYAGKINKDTIGPIRRFIEAVERLKGQGQAITFGIHSPYPFEEIECLLGASAKEVYLGKIPYAELPAAYRKADGLLLPLDFTEATIRYIRLSMLTKASEYMISGTPIFCFAPAGIAVTEYLLEHDAAIHCGEPENLDAAILDFIQDAEARKRVAENAVSRAQSHHMMGQVNERLRNLLRQISEETLKC